MAIDCHRDVDEGEKANEQVVVGHRRHRDVDEVVIGHCEAAIHTGAEANEVLNVRPEPFRHRDVLDTLDDDANALAP